MVAINYLLNNFYFGYILWEQKINILGGIFLGLSIYCYFYDKKIKIRQINYLKQKSNIINTHIVRIKALQMSELETFQVKEILVDHITKSEEFVSEVRTELKSINQKISDEIRAVIQVLTDYMLANDKRVGELEADQKVTKREIAIYVSIASTFVMLAINIYMTIKGG